MYVYVMPSADLFDRSWLVPSSFFLILRRFYGPQTVTNKHIQ